ncbi:3-oxoadipate enol-lactonase [Cupriavidus basilensis]
MAALMDALAVPEAHFVGALGGRHDRADDGSAVSGRLLSLTLVDTVNRTPLDAHPMWHDRIGHVESARQRRACADSTLERWLSAPYRAAHPEEAQRVREMILSTPVHGYVGSGQRHHGIRPGRGDRTHSLPHIGGGRRGGPGRASGDGAREKLPRPSPARAWKMLRAGGAPCPSRAQAGRFSHCVLDAFLGNAACGAQCEAP